MIIIVIAIIILSSFFTNRSRVAIYVAVVIIYKNHRNVKKHPKRVNTYNYSYANIYAYAYMGVTSVTFDVPQDTALHGPISFPLFISVI